MKNRRYYYLAEGECEKKILDALKQTPPLIHPGKTDTFNVIQDELKPRQLMNFAPGSCVVLVFDTDKDETEHVLPKGNKETVIADYLRNAGCIANTSAGRNAIDKYPLWSYYNK